MKTYTKRALLIVLAMSLLFSLTGCSLFKTKSKEYSNYVTGILDMNYKGEYEYYTDATGATDEDAQAIYDAGINSLAESMINYYGIKIVDDGATKDKFIQLAKDIYSHSKYDVSKAYKEDDVYYVDVTVYPMDIMDLTHDNIVAYIDEFNNNVEKGNYDDYEIEDYEVEFANGILDIINAEIPNIGYKDSQKVTVTIKTGDYYYISEDDFLNIDKYIITDSAKSDDATSEAATSEESTSEDTSEDASTTEENVE